MKHQVVFVPGTLCNAKVFGPLLDLMPEVSALHRGLGSHRSVEAAAVAALAAAPDRFVGIGFSLGGFVVLEMLRRAPDRLSGVALISGNAHPDAPENAAMRLAQVERARVVGMNDFIAENWPSWSRTENYRAFDLTTEMANDLGHDAHERHATMNINRPDLRHVATSSPKPILVLAGENDVLCPLARYVTAASGPQGRLTIIAKAGHYLPLEAPDALAMALRTSEIMI